MEGVVRTVPIVEEEQWGQASKEPTLRPAQLYCQAVDATGGVGYS